MSRATQLKTLNSIILDLVGDEPDSVGSSLNGICLDLELDDSEIMENIGAGNVENYRRVDRYSKDIRVGVTVGISKNPIELVTRDLESWATLFRNLGLIICRNAVTPSSVRWSIWEKSVHSGK